MFARAFSLGLAILLTFSCYLRAEDDEARVKEIAARYERYELKIGDRAFLFASHKGSMTGGWAATTTYYFHDYTKALSIRDDDGREELLTNGDVVRLAPETPVLVLDIKRVEIKSGKEDDASTRVEIRILSGPHKGEKLYTPNYHVVRRKEK